MKPCECKCHANAPLADREASFCGRCTETHTTRLPMFYYWTYGPRTDGNFHKDRDEALEAARKYEPGPKHEEIPKRNCCEYCRECRCPCHDGYHKNPHYGGGVRHAEWVRNDKESK